MAAVYHYLRKHFHWQRRAVLAAYRKYEYPLLWDEEYCRRRYREQHTKGRCYKAYSSKRPFDLSRFVHQGGEELGLTLHNEHHILEDEESIVFQVPGWETWDVGDIGRMRVYEEMIEERQLTDIWFGHRDVELEDYWDSYYKGLLQVMEGRRTVSDEVLEERLRAEKLDPEEFWLSRPANERFPYQ